jgi:hypothetical protein
MMPAISTPSRSILSRLVHYVSTPRQTPSRKPEPAEPQKASTSNRMLGSASVGTPAPSSSPAAAASPAESRSSSPSRDWSAGANLPRYLCETDNMFDAIIPASHIQTPQRRPVSRARTCPPKRRNARVSARAQRIEMPRSAIKKRPAPDDKDDFLTPTVNKRVKFNSNLTQERIISPTIAGERACAPTHLQFCGKKRPRATDTYVGREFSESPNIFDQESPSKRTKYEAGDESTCDTETTPTTQHNTLRNRDPRPGTFILDYDAYGLDDSMTDELDNGTAQPPSAANPLSSGKQPNLFALEFSDDSSIPDTPSKPQSLPATANSSPAKPSPTPAKSTLPSAKPSPVPATFSPSSALDRPAGQIKQTPTQIQMANDPPPPPPPLPSNAAAIDAELDALQWPSPLTYVDAGIASRDILDLLNDQYDDDDRFYAQQWWDREYAKFGDALNTAQAEGRELAIGC